MCLSGPLGGRSDAEGRAIVVDGLRRAAAAATEAGVRLGFEPVHPAQRDTAGFVTSLADALALLDEAGAADVGIMADTFNLGHEATDEIVAAARAAHGAPRRGRAAGAGSRRPRAARARRAVGRADRRSARRRLGRHARRRDLLDARRVLGAAGRRGGAPGVRRVVGAVLTGWTTSRSTDSTTSGTSATRPRASGGSPRSSSGRGTRRRRYVAETLTQLARAQGLQRRFDDADRTLDDAEAALGSDDDRGRIRLLLERGRVANTAGREGRGPDAFLAAWELARAAGEDALAVDAAHMLGIVEPPDAPVEWNERAMELARSSTDPAARRWVASLANNMAWATARRRRLRGGARALPLALVERERQDDPDRTRIARWSVARCLRSLGRTRRRSPSSNRSRPSSRRSGRSTATSPRRSPSASARSAEPERAPRQASRSC